VKFSAIRLKWYGDAVCSGTHQKMQSQYINFSKMYKKLKCA